MLPLPLAVPSLSDVLQIFDPLSYTFTESNTAWHKIDVPKQSVLVAQDPTATVIRFRPRNPGTAAGSAYGTSRQGVAPLMAAGAWFVQLPIVGAAAAVRTVFLLDYAMYAGAFDGLMGVPVVGTVPGTATKVAIATSSTALVAASASRARVTFSNPPGGVDVWLAFGAEAAVVGEGIGLFPGETIEMDPTDGFASSAVNAIADGAAQDIGVQVWT